MMQDYTDGQGRKFVRDGARDVWQLVKDETYNGWSNRETWALNLWLSNDAGMYEMACERAAQRVADNAKFAREGDVAYFARIAGEAIKDLWDELTDESGGLLATGSILEMVRDVGSVHRVDWDEIGAAWLEDES